MSPGRHQVWVAIDPNCYHLAFQRRRAPVNRHGLLIVELLLRSLPGTHRRLYRAIAWEPALWRFTRRLLRLLFTHNSCFCRYWKTWLIYDGVVVHNFAGVIGKVTAYIYVRASWLKSAETCNCYSLLILHLIKCIYAGHNDVSLSFSNHVQAIWLKSSERPRRVLDIPLIPFFEMFS
jgi:hypothetical protein